MEIHAAGNKKASVDTTRGDDSVASAAKSPKWYLLYFLLAAFDILTVSASLMLNHQLISSFAGSVALNREWADRLGAYGQLSELATAVNMPGNEVFDTLDIEGEQAEQQLALARFEQALAIARNDLEDNVSSEQAAPLLIQVDRISTAMRDMTRVQIDIFEHFRNREPELAGSKMATMDRKNANVAHAIREMGLLVRQIQDGHFETQAKNAELVRRFEVVIGVMIVVMVIGVTLYGHRIAGQVRRGDESLRAAVESARKSSLHAQDALRQVTSLRDALDKHTLFSITDAKGRIIDVNEGFCRISGYTREELLGQNHRLLNSGHHPKSFWTQMWRTIRSGQHWRAEVCNRSKDGSLYWVDSTNIAQLDETGKPERFISLRFDITRQKEAEQESARIREELAEITTALDAANDCVFMFEADTLKFVYTNSGATEQVGYSSEEMRQMTPLSIKPDFDEPAFREFVQPLINAPGTSMKFRTVHEHRDGHRIPVEISLQMIAGIGAAGRFIAVVRDITEQLEAESRLEAAKISAESASQAKSEFLANMSHEIRTPMTAILGYADLLDSDGDVANDPDKAASAIQIIRNNANSLLTILNDILDMSKIESGKLNLEMIDTSPGQIAEEVTSLLSQRAEGKGIDLSLKYLSSMPVRIKSDPTRLRQVLLNLVGNAIKFTEVGGVSLQVSCNAPAQQMQFRVIDTGIGMNPDQREMISRFDAFTQADNSTTRNFGGTGLGLRISSALAEMLGGGIEISSELGKGSIFTLTVATGDLRDVEFVDEKRLPNLTARERNRPQTNMDKPNDVLLGLRILFAEDGPDNQRLISFILKKAGAEVTLAEDGRVALEEAISAQQGERPFDVVLMDMQMPVMDGYTASAQLRAEGYSGPIIALTAHAMSSDREKCIAAGCNDYLTKPVDREFLFDAILKHAAARQGTPKG